MERKRNVSGTKAERGKTTKRHTRQGIQRCNQRRAKALRLAKKKRLEEGIRRRIEEALEDDCEADAGSVDSGASD